MFHLTADEISTASRTRLEYEIYGQEDIYSLFDEARLVSGQYATEEYRAKLGQWVDDE